jgi:hypothetical protein
MQVPLPCVHTALAAAALRLPLRVLCQPRPRSAHLHRHWWTSTAGAMSQMRVLIVATSEARLADSKTPTGAW